MQSHWVNDAPYYRCRFPSEYALANHVEHPLNVNLRGDAVIGRIDKWLAREFAPHRITETIRGLAVARQPDIDHESAERPSRARSRRATGSLPSTAVPSTPGRTPSRWPAGSPR